MAQRLGQITKTEESRRPLSSYSIQEDALNTVFHSLLLSIMWEIKRRRWRWIVMTSAGCTQTSIDKGYFTEAGLPSGN